MKHSAKILADSISTTGCRLTTFEVRFPRIVLAEFNTHRMFSRCSASSRAIPVEKMIARVEDDPYEPIHWGANQRGMQAEHEVGEATQDDARTVWLRARDTAVSASRELIRLGIHKQITNRLLEPFMWHTVIVTATDWDNFWHLRIHPNAHPEIRAVAELMQEAYTASTPEMAHAGHWHTPLLDDRDELTRWASKKYYTQDLVFPQVSAARCARISYLTHEGKRDPDADLELYERLVANGHMSPLEHVARHMHSSEIGMFTQAQYRMSLQREWTAVDGRKSYCGNFNGWIQLRKLIANEHDILAEQETAP